MALGELGWPLGGVVVPLGEPLGGVEESPAALTVAVGSTVTDGEESGHAV